MQRLNPMQGLNLAKGSFPAKQCRSGAKIGRKLAHYVSRNSQNGAPGSRKVRRKSLPRSFERTGGLNPSEQAVQSRQHAWSNGKRELLVRVPAQLGSALSDNLAEFLGFARLRPTRRSGSTPTNFICTATIRRKASTGLWLFRNSRENEILFESQPNISNGLARRESEF